MHQFSTLVKDENILGNHRNKIGRAYFRVVEETGKGIEWMDRWETQSPSELVSCFIKKE